jgi:hypothetical protein
MASLPFGVWDVVDKGVSNTGSGDQTSAIAALAAAAPAAGVSALWFRPGRYRVPGNMVMSGIEGVTLVGAGSGQTLIDNSGSTAHTFDLSHTWSCGVTGMSFVSSTNRTAGSSLRINGGHTSHMFDQATETNCHIDDVEFSKQFNGLEIFDDDSSYPGGAWGVYAHRLICRDMSLNGVPLLINSRYGGIHIIRDAFIGPTTIGGTRPLAGVRVLASNDFTLDRVSQIACQYGLLADPSVAGAIVRAGNITNCFFDTNTEDAIKLAPGAGTILDQLHFVDTWAASSKNLINVLTGADGCEFVGMKLYRAVGTSSNGWGVRFDGATRCGISKSKIGGAVSGGVLLTGSSRDCGVDGVTVWTGPADYGMPTAPPVGIQIDLGCLDYVVTNNNTRGATTHVTDNGGAVSKTVTGNI